MHNIHVNGGHREHAVISSGKQCKYMLHFSKVIFHREYKLHGAFMIKLAFVWRDEVNFEVNLMAPFLVEFNGTFPCGVQGFH